MSADPAKSARNVIGQAGGNFTSRRALGRIIRNCISCWDKCYHRAAVAKHSCRLNQPYEMLMRDQRDTDYTCEGMSADTVSSKLCRCIRRRHIRELPWPLYSRLVSSTSTLVLRRHFALINGSANSSRQWRQKARYCRRGDH